MSPEVRGLKTNQNKTNIVRLEGDGLFIAVGSIPRTQTRTHTLPRNYRAETHDVGDNTDGHGDDDDDNNVASMQTLGLL